MLATDTKNMMVRRVALPAAAALFAAALGVFVAPHHARASSPANGCRELLQTLDGVSYKILFANNGKVQQYVLVTSSHRTETDHDVRTVLEQRFGQEGVDTPPLHIASFRKGEAGMMIPDKATDSCGRTVDFK